MNTLIITRSQESIFTLIPGWADSMREFYENPLRVVTPLCYGWFTQDSLKDILLELKARTGKNKYNLLKFRKGRRILDKDSEGYYHAFFVKAQEVVESGVQEDLIPTIMDVWEERGRGMQSEEGGTGRSGS